MAKQIIGRYKDIYVGTNQPTIVSTEEGTYEINILHLTPHNIACENPVEFHAVGTTGRLNLVNCTIETTLHSFWDVYRPGTQAILDSFKPYKKSLEEEEKSI